MKNPNILSRAFSTQLFLLFSILLFVQSLTAQTEWCNTLEGVPALSGQGITVSTDPLYFEVAVHVVRSSQQAGYDETDVNEAFAQLRDAFAQHNIFFKRSCNINYIDNDTYYNFDVTPFDDSEVCDIENLVTSPTAIDLFLLDESRTSFARARFGNKLFLSGQENGCVVTSLPKSIVMAHEMGHVLGLYHTHHGTVFEGSGTGSCVNADDPEQCEECPNVSSDDCGDYVADTPADPDISGEVNPADCSYLGTRTASTTNCSGETYNPDTRNIMSYSCINCLNSFTDGQADRMRGYVDETLSLIGAKTTESSFCNCSSSSQNITSNTLWDRDIYVPGDIVVKAGAELKITARAFMQCDAQIYVERGAKIILDGGTLEPWIPDTEWAGISVQGNSNKEQPNVSGALQSDDAGVVWMYGGATVRNAKNAIRTLDYRQPWPAFKDYYGGLVVLDGVDFIDCGRAVEFMQYRFNNRSRFQNTRFINEAKAPLKSGTGVTIWDCRGISFRSCDFIDLGKGIGTIDGVFAVIDDNHFLRCGRGVDSYATATSRRGVAIGGGLIPALPNVFEDCTTPADIRGHGVINIDAAVVKASSFSRKGFTLEATRSGFVQNCVFTNIEKPLRIINGNTTMRIQCNEVNAPFDAVFLSLLGDNSRTIYTSNDINVSNICADDVRYARFGGVKLGVNIGDPEFPANNCFSAGEDIKYTSADGNFSYFVYDQETNACRIPSDNLSDGGVNEYFLANSDIPENGNTCMQPEVEGLTELRDSTLAWQQKWLNGQGSLSTSALGYIAARRNDYFSRYTDTLMDSGQYSQAKSFIDSSNYGLIGAITKYYIGMETEDYGYTSGQLTLANSQNLISNSTKDVFQISADRLLNAGNALNLSSGDVTTLQNYIQNEGVFSGVAIGMLELVGETYADVLPDLDPCGGGGGSSALTEAENPDLGSASSISQALEARYSDRQVEWVYYNLQGELIARFEGMYSDKSRLYLLANQVDHSEILIEVVRTLDGEHVHVKKHLILN